MKICRFPECKTTRLQRWGLCNKHRKWVEKGYFTVDLLKLKELPQKNTQVFCKIRECGREYRRNGFCERHSKQYREGILNADGIRVRPLVRYSSDFKCIKCGRGGKIVKGFCKLHYDHLREGIIDYDGTPLRALKKIPSYKGMYCTGCKKRKPRIKGLCPNCHDKVRRGTMTRLGVRLKAPPSKNEGKTCVIKDCIEPATCKLMCRKHYSKSKARPRIFVNKNKTCSALTCKRKAVVRGLCTMHYVRRKRRLALFSTLGKPPPFIPLQVTTQVGSPPSNLVPLCETTGCDKPVISKGLCWKHYMRIRRKERRLERELKKINKNKDSGESPEPISE